VIRDNIRENTEESLTVRKDSPMEIKYLEEVKKKANRPTGGGKLRRTEARGSGRCKGVGKDEQALEQRPRDPEPERLTLQVAIRRGDY